MEQFEPIVVDKQIKPVHHTEREAVELIMGNEYYVSFGKNQARKCTLVDIDKASERIVIKIAVKPRDKDSDKQLFSTHIIFNDEIGATPEQAVINEVSI